MAATTLGRGPQTLKECQGVAMRNIVSEGDPRRAPETAAVCLAVAAGYRWGKPKPYLDAVEEIGGELRRRVTWAFDAASQVVFDGERVVFGRFWEYATGAVPCGNELPSLCELMGVFRAAASQGLGMRWAGEELRSRAPDHPRVAPILRETAAILADFLTSSPRRFLLMRETRGKVEIRIYIPLDATPEEREKLLRDAGLL